MCRTLILEFSQINAPVTKPCQPSAHLQVTGAAWDAEKKAAEGCRTPNQEGRTTRMVAPLERGGPPTPSGNSRGQPISNSPTTRLCSPEPPAPQVSLGKQFYSRHLIDQMNLPARSSFHLQFISLLYGLMTVLTAGPLHGRAADTPTFQLTHAAPAPDWAIWQRRALEEMFPAAMEFIQRYTLADGTIVWRDSWPGMDGSDDGYESFYNFPLYYALGGPAELHPLSVKLWEGVTRQFTRYGQVHNEFDGYYDWMHHGESYVNFYFFGLADPHHAAMRARAFKFAGLYLNEDSTATNFDFKHQIIRSPLNGSRGPRFDTTVEDWSTHRDDLAPYPLPYEDIPGVTSGRDWLDDVKVQSIIGTMNQRMMRGDVPLNLAATSLILHAQMHENRAKYRRWVLNYVNAWRERVRRNGGILPDNVGLSGKIGENMRGNWWGGYYGWKWPHGLFNQIEGTLIGGANALTLTGDRSFLELPRSVIEMVRREGRMESGRFVVPHRHDERGWYNYQPIQASYLIHLWYLSQDPKDYARIEAMAATENWTKLNYHKAKGDFGHEGPWLRFLEGKYPDYPVDILKAGLQETARRMQMVRADRTTVDEQDVHHWQQRNPVVLEGLVQTMMGGPNHIYHGGLLHVRLRYFDPLSQRAGMPPDVAALVEKISPNSVVLTLANLSKTEMRDVVVQAGAFGEHKFTRVQLSGKSQRVSGKHLRFRLNQGTVTTVELGMKRYAQAPSYDFPW